MLARPDKLNDGGSSDMVPDFGTMVPFFGTECRMPHMDINPFTYGSPLSPGEGIPRPEETQLLLRMALSGQNTRVSAPRRYGKTTLIEDLRAEAERHGLNTVRVDLYGVLSRADVALRLERAYESLRGPVQRYVKALLPRAKLKASAGMGPAKLEAETTAPATDGADRLLIDLLDLPVRFHDRKGARTLIIFDEFQDVLQAGDGVDAVLRSRIQHQREAASYLFAGSHPGMLEELFGDRRRPLYDQARSVMLEPLGALAVAEYVEERFVQTSRSAARPLDALIELADGHPQRVMMLAHHLWEHTPAGEHATEDAWESAVAAVFSELQEQYERSWSAYPKHADRAVLATIAAGRSRLLAAATLRELDISKTTVVHARDRLLHTGDLQRDGQGGVSLVDPLYATWIAAGRRSPHQQRQRPAAFAEDGVRLSPFGMADGARASLGDLGRGYVEVGDPRSAMRTLRTIRVIVGKKGAGKTLWLRRQHASLAGDRSLYVTDADYTAPLTAEVVRVSQWYPRHLLTEVWSSIWRVALLRTVVSHLTTRQRLGPHHLSAPNLWPPFSAPVSLGSQVRDVLGAHHSRRHLESYLLRPEWEQVEQSVGAALHNSPPMYFFFDALDEEFQHAPAYWLAAQKGLYFQLMRVLVDGRFGNRLHVSIGLRDLAYVSMLATEHATRYVDNRHIHVLRWDEAKIGYLLAEKLRGLDNDHLLRPELGPTIKGWLGHAEIPNAVRRTSESLDRYMLRHTRLLPRDVIVMGNSLCRLVTEAKEAGARSVGLPEICATISRAAQLFGREQLAICANQISAELMPADASKHGYDAIYTGTDASEHGLAYVAGIEEKLRAALQAVGVDHFGPDRMTTLHERLECDFGTASAPLAALWQNGLLGYVEDDGMPTFYGATEYDELRMPLYRSSYVLHPMGVYALGLRQAS